MKLHDSFKQYVDGGVSKLIPPEATVENAFQRLGCMKYPILEYHRKVDRPSGIPQYVFAVNDNFRRFKAKTTNTNGKGHIPVQAMASGLMEMAERYSCFKHTAFRNGNIALRARFSDIPENEFSLNSLLSIITESPGAQAAPEVGNARMAFYRGWTLDGRPVLLPLNFLHYFVSANGMAAGNSLEEALVHGIGEVIERHCLAVIGLRKIETPVIKPESVENPVAIDLMKRLNNGNQRLIIRDFSLGLGLPVIGVIRIIDAQNCLVTAGVATRPDEALIRALTENSQADHSMHYQALSSCGHYLAETAAVPMDRIPGIDHPNLKTELETIGTLLEKHGMTAMYVDTTDEELAIPSVIALITGAKIDSSVASASPSDFLRALIEESLFLEDYREAARFISKGFEIDPGNEIYIYYQAICHAFQKEFAEAEACFERFRDTRKLENFYKQRIFALLALCHFMTGNRAGLDAVRRQLTEWNSNSTFNWHESYFQIVSDEVKQFRMRELFPYLERIKQLSGSGRHREMTDTIHNLLKFNIYSGLLFNHQFLNAMANMTIGNDHEARTCFIRAKKYLPDEPICDELIMKCRQNVRMNNHITLQNSHIP